MFTTKTDEKTEKLTYCTDCVSIFEVSEDMGAWIKCPYCGLHFQFTKRVERRR